MLSSPTGEFFVSQELKYSFIDPNRPEKFPPKLLKLKIIKLPLNNSLYILSFFSRTLVSHETMNDFKRFETYWPKFNIVAFLLFEMYTFQHFLSLFSKCIQPRILETFQIELNF